MAIVAGAAACAGGTGPDSPPASVPAASSPPGTQAPDLSTVLRQPAGYIADPDYSLAGPIGRSNAHKIFSDHPDGRDAVQILGHGFEAGYLRAWRRPPPTSYQPDAATDVVIGFVLRFDTAEHARSIVKYFRDSNAADGYRLFPVPAELDGGYGGEVGGADTVGSAVGVVWARGRDVFNLMAQTSGAPVTEQQVISLAVEQNRR